MEDINQKDIYKTSRFLYIIEAALEYFISLLMTGAYIAKIATAIGMSDSLTAVLISFIALGQGFQIFAIFLSNKRPVKRWVTFLHILSQLFFSTVYLFPVFPMPPTLKSVLFFVFILGGYIIHNIINSPKINWFMALVDHDKVGVFTANKEIVSLLSGMIFTYAMGSVIDHFEALGDINTAFTIGAITLFALTLLHTLTLLFSKEKPAPKEDTGINKGSFKAVLSNKFVWKIVALSAMFGISMHISVPFYGTYQNIELGFSMTFISIISIVGSVSRALVSRKIGRFGNKTSFVNSLSLCYGLTLIAFVVNIFTNPSNGHYMYLIYHLIYCIGAAGTTSGQLNLVYHEVEESQRMAAFALLSSATGVCGFLTTLAVTPLFNLIQANGNSLFGIPVYAQQVLSLLAAAMMLITLLFLNLVVRKKKAKAPSEDAPAKIE